MSPYEHDNQTAELPEAAWLTALLSLPKMGPRRLDALIDQEGSARSSWDRIRADSGLRLANTSSDILAGWREAAGHYDVVDRWVAMQQLGIRAATPTDANFPERLLLDPHRPRLIFQRGTLPSGPTVGIVGTRTCTAYGQRCAFELGRALVEAGISVVSGLALGIDAAAHQGALAGSPDESDSDGTVVGVVGSGLDVVYPKRNERLWETVGSVGALLSETPPGIKPAAWRFPARNRIIAGLSDAIVVIESHERGGSLLTVDEAQLRDVPVGAIPGPITSSSAAGTNRLLADGATPILEVDDIFSMIGFTPPTAVRTQDAETLASDLLDAMGWTPVVFEQLCQRVTLPAAQLAAEIEQLCLRGFLQRKGPWIERVR